MMLRKSPCRPTVAVSSHERAEEFYGHTLGLELVNRTPVGMTFECGDGTFLEVYESPFAGSAKHTVVGFEVEDLEATMKEMRGAGVRFEEYEAPKTENGIAQLGPNRGAWFADPDGNLIALVQVDTA